MRQSMAPLRRAACALALALAAIASGAHAAEARRGDVVLPFQSVNRTIFIRVTVSGRPLWFVLDTGDKYAVIDLAIARSLGLPLAAPVAVGGGGKQTVTGYLLKGSPFGVPQIRGFSQPLFLALPLDDLARFSGHQFAGVLGFDFISRFVVEIDYRRHRITLHDKDGYRYGGAGQAFPLTFNAAAHPQIAARVLDGSAEPVDGTFVVDIGSGAGLILNRPFVEAQGFLATGRPVVPWLEGRGLGGGVDGAIGRVAGLGLGAVTIRDPVTVFSRAESGPFASAEAQGNIGAAILEKFRVILDYPRSRMILEPNDQLGRPMAYDRSGLVLSAEGADYRRFKVEAVAEGSPASEAGIEAGDRLVSIDGRPASRFALSEIRHLFQQTVTRRLGFLRDGGAYAVRLKPRTRI